MTSKDSEQLVVILHGLFEIEAMRGANEAMQGCEGRVVYYPDDFRDVKTRVLREISIIEDR